MIRRDKSGKIKALKRGNNDEICCNQITCVDQNLQSENTIIQSRILNFVGPPFRRDLLPEINIQ